MATVVEPEKPSIPGVVGPFEIIWNSSTGDAYRHVSICITSDVYNACIHHRRGFVAQISDEEGDSRSMLALTKAVMAPIVVPKRASPPGVVGPSKIL